MYLGCSVAPSENVVLIPGSIIQRRLRTKLDDAHLSCLASLKISVYFDNLVILNDDVALWYTDLISKVLDCVKVKLSRVNIEKVVKKREARFDSMCQSRFANAI